MSPHCCCSFKKIETTSIIHTGGRRNLQRQSSNALFRQKGFELESTGINMLISCSSCLIHNFTDFISCGCIMNDVKRFIVPYHVITDSQTALVFGLKQLCTYKNTRLGRYRQALIIITCMNRFSLFFVRGHHGCPNH